MAIGILLVMTPLERFESMLRLEQKSSETIRTYKKGIVKFLRYLDGNNITLSGQAVLPWTMELTDAEGASPGTVKLYMIALKRYFEFLKEQGITDVTFPKMKYPTVGRGKPKFMDKDEFLRLYQGAENDLLLRAMISATYSTAMRVSEVCSRKVSDFDLNAYTVEEGKKFSAPTVKVSGKTPEDTDATLPLSDVAVMDIKAYLKEVKQRTGYEPLPNAFMFFWSRDPSKSVSPRMINERLYNLCRRLGMKSRSWHMIRHSRATHLRQDGARMEDIQDLLRHRSMNTTLIYAVTDTEKLRRKVSESDILGAKKEPNPVKMAGGKGG